MSFCRSAPTENERPWDAQLAAITAWGIPDVSMLNRLAGNHASELRRQRRQRRDDAHEEQLPTRRALADAHVRIYADANHGFLYHYPELFGDHVRVFLSG
jgi:hypothetical protein